MSDFENLSQQCKIDIKAFQNIRAAFAALERICEMVDSDDHVILSSLFHAGVIRYGKPFKTTRTKSGTTQFPVKRLKNIKGFEKSIHDHLLELRDTLIAHDDLNQIEPKILTSGISVQGADLHIPMTAHISNKSLSHPADLEGAMRMKNHVESALRGVESVLSDDINQLRQKAIDEPEQAREAQEYSRNLGSIDIPEGGAHTLRPDLSDDPYLNPDEPDFSEIHNGFRYETITINKEFNGPETIKLPNGHSIKITPQDDDIGE